MRPDPADEIQRILEEQNRGSAAPAWGALALAVAAAAGLGTGIVMHLKPVALGGILGLPCALGLGLYAGRALPAKGAGPARAAARIGVALAVLGLLALGIAGTIAKFRH